MEEEKKKNTFLFVFSTYIHVLLLKFRSGELVGCGIKFHIEWVPTWHTFDGPCYRKNQKYLKKCDDDIIITFFQVFFVFGVEGSFKSMPSGYSLNVEFNFASNELSRSKFEYAHHHHVFSGISCFWGSKVCQKYAEWVIVGCGIKSASNELSRSKFD